jgi:hypothetical protein
MMNLPKVHALSPRRGTQVDAWGLRQPLPAAGSCGRLHGPRLVMRDAVHLFSPGARHHHVLAREGTASPSPGAPSVALLISLQDVGPRASPLR